MNVSGEATKSLWMKDTKFASARDGPSKLAVCRDETGQVHTHSASYTHLGCIVHWNSTEQCWDWDCPCHGSQFAPDETVLNGPAVQPLTKNGEQCSLKERVP
jgi:Rieske Fe-S protein